MLVPVCSAILIEEVDHIRRLRRRYWISLIAIPVLLLIGLAAVEYVHPAFILLFAVPVAAVRIYSVKLSLVKCPKCGDFYNGDPRRPFDWKTVPWGWGILEKGSRCANCDFPA